MISATPHTKYVGYIIIIEVIITHIRRMNDGEFKIAINLITQTVHTVCSADYTKEELDAWAPSSFNTRAFVDAVLRSYNLFAIEDGIVVGFISIEKDGYINRLFTHKDYQRRGIATALMAEAEKWAKKNKLSELSLDSSKTAVGFYEKCGFYKSGISVVKRRNVVFRNTVMKKSLGGD